VVDTAHTRFEYAGSCWLSVSIRDTENKQLVHFGGMNSDAVPAWLAGILNRTYQYCDGSWNLGKSKCRE